MSYANPTAYIIYLEKNYLSFMKDIMLKAPTHCGFRGKRTSRQIFLYFYAKRLIQTKNL
jgi:hypothetical protein